MVDLDSDTSGSRERERTGSLVLVGLAVLALILGALGVYIGFSAHQEVSAFRAELETKLDRTVELEEKIESLETRLIKVGGETVRIDKQIRSVVTQTQRAFDDVTREVKANREQGNKTNKQLAQFAAGVAPTSVIRAEGSSAASPSPSGTSAAEVSPDGFHTIQSGESFEKLARIYGTSVPALLEANPGVDPRRLQIGQKVNIPK